MTLWKPLRYFGRMVNKEINMPDDLRLRSAQVSFLNSVRKTVDESYEQSQRQNKPISDGMVANQLAAADFFDAIFIDSQVAEAIRNATNLSFGPSSGDISVGQLLREAKTLRKAKGWVRKAETYVRSRPVDESVVIPASTQCSEIDYLKELYHCLELITILVKKSKRTQRKKEGYFLEYCALCWRLVNKNKILNFDESADYSASYCLKHHPKKSDWEYHHARSALLAAIDNSDHELKGELIDRKKNKRLTPLFLYKSTARFTTKPPAMVLDMLHTGDSWKDRAARIIEASKSYYPTASEAIKAIPIAELSSWEAWFYAVINALDPSGKDASSWDDARVDWKSMSDDQSAASKEVGEEVLLNILHRYEAVSRINSTPRPRGPKKGTVATNEALRADITLLANLQKEKNNKINASQIAKYLKISRQRVSVLLKELGLR